MVIPLPAGLIPVQIGPPTEFAMKMRPFFILLLFAMFMLLMGRLFIMLDIVPGFFFSIIIVMGYYAVHVQMDIQWMCYFGITCLFCGVLDLVHLIDAIVKSPPFFDRRYPFIINLVNSIRVSVPLVQLLGAYMVYLLYQDYHNAPGGDSGFLVSGPNNRRAGPTPIPVGGYGGTAQEAGARQPQRGRSEADFKPFSGQGQTLGSTNA